MTNKESYKELCDSEKSIPIFSQYWWLDAVCGPENWEVSMVFNKEKKIMATLPYYINKKYGFKRLVLPKLTQKLGPWLKTPEGQKYESRLSYEHQQLDKLIDNLPRFDEFYQKIDSSYTNWLPFYWRGFKQSTHYTYQLTNLEDLDGIYANFKSNIKREIKKAQKNNIQISNTPDIDLFYKINALTFARQKIKIPYTIEFLTQLDKRIEKNRKMYFAVDEEKRIHATIYIVWDHHCAYYLMGGGDPELRNSGATSYLMWTAIKEMSEKVNVFDFEGSMIKPIERFFRSFGALQIPYNSISKINSKRLKLAYFIKELIKK